MWLYPCYFESRRIRNAEDTNRQDIPAVDLALWQAQVEAFAAETSKDLQGFWMINVNQANGIAKVILPSGAKPKLEVLLRCIPELGTASGDGIYYRRKSPADQAEEEINLLETLPP